MTSSKSNLRQEISETAARLAETIRLPAVGCYIRQICLGACHQCDERDVCPLAELTKDDHEAGEPDERD
jgi:hypothetical protein